jgi:hypothetical protein
MAKKPDCLKAFFIAFIISVATIPVLATQKTILLGPTDGGAEQGDQWYSGASEMAYVSVGNSDPNTGNNYFVIGNKTAGNTNRADWRSQPFNLGPAAGGVESMTFSFAYKFPGKVNRGDNIAVFFRFFDESGTTFLGQHYIPLGSSTGDSEMTSYKTVTLTNLKAVRNATGVRLPKGARTVTADIWVTCNTFSPWTSGDSQFDDFTVTTVPGPPWLRRHWFVTLALGPFIIVVIPTLTVWAIRKRRAV